MKLADDKEICLSKELLFFEVKNEIIWNEDK